VEKVVSRIKELPLIRHKNNRRSSSAVLRVHRFLKLVEFLCSLKNSSPSKVQARFR